MKICEKTSVLKMLSYTSEKYVVCMIKEDYENGLYSVSITNGRFTQPKLSIRIILHNRFTKLKINVGQRIVVI